VAKPKGVTFPPTFPPTMMNLAWRFPKGGGVHDLEELGIDFANHLAEGPCPCYLFVLLPAHSGPVRNWLCWIYNDFSDVDRERRFWRGDAPAEFMREHRVIGKRFAAAYRGGGDLWMVLRDDLSHRPRIGVTEFAKIRFITMDEIRVRPGHEHEFEELRRLVTSAYGAAKIDGPVWVYEIYSGAPTGSFQIWTPIKSASELDQVTRIRGSVNKALGEAGRGQVAKLASSSIADSETALLSISPGRSYSPPNLKAADPDYWSSTTKPFP
jgi:hypothetical protein